MSEFSASSPGRLDVMGGIADYSGSLVLQMPVRNSTTVTIQLRNDFNCLLQSHLKEGDFKANFNYKELVGGDYQAAQAALTKNKDASWIAYILGCVFVLEKEKGIKFQGADFRVESNVPLGKGVSSSAALEVATMKALGKAFQLDFQGTELPILAQRVENVIVGAPCGLMDQLSSYFGKAGELLPILCQPDLIQGPIRIPGELHFIGIDSGVRHAVSGSSYSDVRCAAFMGYSIIAQHLGISTNQIKQAKETSQWKSLPYGGYLCNIPVKEFESRLKELLPAQISGKEFIEKYQGTTDVNTIISPGVHYSILNCTSHPIYENERVKRFQGLILNWGNESNQARELGELMNQSHLSYSLCGLGSERTDEIVRLAKDFQNSGIYGAKITGGGSGGTVCLLAIGQEGLRSAKKIHHMMEDKYRTKLAYFD